jgi:predicted amidophosphoribosyltransferase
MATVTTLTWAQTAALNPHKSICLACGADLTPIPARLGSLHCHACRAALHPPLGPDLAVPHPRRTHD